MNVSFEKLKTLNHEELEKLLGWGIQRQLRWAVMMVTALIALLQLYLHMNQKYFPYTSNIVSNGIWQLLGLTTILVLVTSGLLLSETRTIDYYYYVAKIEGFWVNNNTELKDKRLKKEEVFTMQGLLDRLLMNCPKNAKLASVSLSLLGIITLFVLLPLL